MERTNSRKLPLTSKCTLWEVSPRSYILTDVVLKETHTRKIKDFWLLRLLNPFHIPYLKIKPTPEGKALKLCFVGMQPAHAFEVSVLKAHL